MPTFEVDVDSSDVFVLTPDPLSIDEDAGDVLTVDETAVVNEIGSGGGVLAWELVSPESLTNVAPRDAIVIDVELVESRLLDLTIYIQFDVPGAPENGLVETVFGNGGFTPRYVGLSRMTYKSEGRRFSIRKASGFPRVNGEIHIHVSGYQGPEPE